MPLICPACTASTISITVRPRCGSSAMSPDFLETPARIRLFHRAVVGIEHRDETGVRSPLNVVLPAQRMQAGAGPAHLAGDQRQGDEAARVVGAVDVLRDPHAPEDHGGPGAGVESRHRAEGFGFNAADLRHGLGRELRHVPSQLLEAVGVGDDVVAIVESLGDDDVEQGVEQRHIGAGLELKHPGRLPPQGLAARIQHDELGAAFGGLLEVGGRHRMVLGGGWRR